MKTSFEGNRLPFAKAYSKSPYNRMIPIQTIWFCIMNNEVWNLCIVVLRMEQSVFERLHEGFTSCAKRALNICMTVLHHEQKGLERLHDGFARVQKGLEVSSWGFCTCTKRY